MRIRLLPATILGFPFVVSGDLRSGPYEAMGHRPSRADALSAAEAHVSRLGHKVAEVETVAAWGRA